MTHDSIDLDLVDKIVAQIPEQAWTQVRQALITTIVDNMPGSVVERLTGDYDNFDHAEEILYDYYELPSKQQDLIVDAFKIMGAQVTVDILDSLKLDQLQSNETNEMPSVSID